MIIALSSIPPVGRMTTFPFLACIALMVVGLIATATITATTTILILILILILMILIARIVGIVLVILVIRVAVWSTVPVVPRSWAFVDIIWLKKPGLLTERRTVASLMRVSVESRLISHLCLLTEVALFVKVG